MQNFTKIENAYLERITRANLTSVERACLDVIIRKTNGFHKDSDEISYSQMVEYTGRSDRAIRYAIQSLKKKLFIEYQKGNIKGVSNRYRLVQNPAQAILDKIGGIKHTIPTARDCRTPTAILGKNLRQEIADTKEILQKKEENLNIKEKTTENNQTAESLTAYDSLSDEESKERKRLALERMRKIAYRTE